MEQTTDTHSDAHSAIQDADDDDDDGVTTYLEKIGITKRELGYGIVACLVAVIAVSVINSTDPATVVGNVIDAIPQWVWDGLAYAVPLLPAAGVAGYYINKKLVSEGGRLLRVHNSGVGPTVDLRLGDARLDTMRVLKPAYDTQKQAPGYVDGELRDLETDLRIDVGDETEEALEAERYYPDRNVAVATAIGVADAQERRSHYNVLERCQRKLKAQADRAKMLADAFPEKVREETDKRVHYYIAAIEGVREPGDMDLSFSAEEILESHELGSAMNTHVDDPTIRSPGILDNDAVPEEFVGKHPATEEGREFRVDDADRVEDPDLRGIGQKARDGDLRAAASDTAQKAGEAVNIPIGGDDDGE